jgi:RNA polymerase sigma factor (sigma-70 family)
MPLPIRRTPLSPLCRAEVLSPDEEQELFRELQSLKHRSRRRSRTHFERIRNRIVTANLRLLIAIARKFATPELPLDELVAAGAPPLIRAAELFDPSRGFRFSTYATHAVRNHLLRVRRREGRRRAREGCVPPELLADCVREQRESVGGRLEADEARVRLLAGFEQLPPRDRQMLGIRFGLNESRPRSFREMAEHTGLSRERVRVLTHRALDRLRELCEAV